MTHEKRLDDVRIWRDEASVVHANVRHLPHHSPTGFECGYGGSGPADLALAILNAFVPSEGPEDRVKLYRGTCSRLAWEHHQAFKWEFLSEMPRAGGTISAQAIRHWIAARLRTVSPESACEVVS